MKDKHWTENTRQKGFPQPRKRWSSRCNWCSGYGEVINWHPKFVRIKCEKRSGTGRVE